jgi:hypothetical protein
MKGVSQCSSGAALMNSYTPLEKFLFSPSLLKYYISNSDLQLERERATTSVALLQNVSSSTLLFQISSAFKFHHSKNFPFFL